MANSSCTNLQQDQNTAKLVMAAFHKVSKNRNGVSADDIARYLLKKFGDVWRVNKLASKAEQTLRKGAVLGFLTRKGSYYMENIIRDKICRCQHRPKRNSPSGRKCGKRRPRRHR